MQKVFDSPLKTPIIFQDFLKKCSESITLDDFLENNGYIQDFMKLTNDTEKFVEIEEAAKVSLLDQGDDVRVTPYSAGDNEVTRKTVLQIPYGALKLNTFQRLLMEKSKSVKNPFGRTRHTYRQIKNPCTQQTTDENIKPFEDLLITVRFYRPKRALTRGGRPQYELPIFAEEFECLGSNLLTELRDKIDCVCNGKRFFDVSADPYKEIPRNETDPGFFFITDTFYNDMRNPTNPDYSRIVLDWTKRARGLSKKSFKTAKMESTKFIDLTASLGFPQLYQHHGNCEHQFTFSFVEYITPASACFKKTHYPLLKSINSFNNRMCNMCGQREYIYIVTDSNRLLHDPAYLCSVCFIGFHYADGKKIGNFSAYKVNDIKSDNDELDLNEIDLDDEISILSEDSKATSKF